ncbi:response regulator [Paenibacillus sp. P25]|nr:response regulator [Paenibacillus sp. P25]
MNIAIVDDNPVNVIVIEKILKSAGYDAFWKASSARELFMQLEEHAGKGKSPLDLILMDMMMPEMDGIEACRLIQKDDRFRDIPVIIVTALGDSNKLAEALEAGAIDYVMKPVNKVELVARIRVALRLKYEKDWHKENEAKIRSELELARQVQTGVLSLPFKKEKLEIDAVYLPSFELAGICTPGTALTTTGTELFFWISWATAFPPLWSACLSPRLCRIPSPGMYPRNL